METIKTKDISVLKYSKELIEEYLFENEVEEFDIDAFSRFLEAFISKDNVGVFVSYAPDKVLGLLVAVVQRTIAFEFVNIILFAHSDDETMNNLFAKLCNWAKEKNINKVSVMTKYPKKYKSMGFAVRTHALDYNINGEAETEEASGI